MTTETPPIITLPSEVETLVAGAQQVKVLAGADNGSPVGVIDYTIGPGFAPPPYLHRHTNEDAGWVVLEGVLEWHLGDGSVVTAEPGSSFVHRKGCWFRWANPDPERPARAICWFSPSGFERFFAEVAARSCQSTIQARVARWRMMLSTRGNSRSARRRIVGSRVPLAARLALMIQP